MLFDIYYSLFMMVRFAFYYCACPVYLLCEYQSYHLMRECEAGKGEEFIGSLV